MVCLNPALPSVRDEHGDVVKLGTVSNENIKPVVDESVNRVMEETIDMVVEKDVWILLDESFIRFFDKAADRVENNVVDCMQGCILLPILEFIPRKYAN